MTTPTEQGANGATPPASPAASHLDTLIAAERAGAQPAPENPPPAGGVVLTEEERRKAAAAGAVMGVAFAESLTMMGMKVFQVEDDLQVAIAGVFNAHRAPIADALGPVLAKNQGEPPAWLVKWKEELVLLGRLGMAVFAAVAAVMQQRAKARKALEGKKQDTAPAT